MKAYVRMELVLFMLHMNIPYSVVVSLPTKVVKKSKTKTKTSRGLRTFIL